MLTKRPWEQLGARGARLGLTERFGEGFKGSVNVGLLAAIFPHRQFSTAAAGEENRASWVLKPDGSTQVSVHDSVRGAYKINRIRLFGAGCVRWSCYNDFTLCPWPW